MSRVTTCEVPSARILLDAMPLKPQMGWDTIDDVKARLGGRETRRVAGLRYYYDCATGGRDGRRRSWESQVAVARYLGYRSYLILRATFRFWHDPSALAILKGWGRAGRRREPRYPDPEVRRFHAREQSLFRLPFRAREVRWQRREFDAMTPNRGSWKRDAVVGHPAVAGLSSQVGE
jgi:hypothetical protein